MNNLNNIETISGGQGNVGNTLIVLNKLINICEKIKCINIISPMGLDSTIEKSILYKDFNNLNILSHYYAHKINIDIKLSNSTVYYFKYIIKSSWNEIRHIEKWNN